MLMGVYGKRLPAVFVFSLLLVAPFYAQEVNFQLEGVFAEKEPPAPVAHPINEIKIVGLKKTRESYMQQVLKKYLGQDRNDIDLIDVETTLEEQGLFSEYEAALDYNEDGEMILLITVQEKISFIPLPFAMYSSNTGFMGGLMVMDTNAFGVKDNYVVGGVFSKSMQMGVMSFSKPSLSRTQPGFSVFATGSHRNNEFTDSNDDTVLEYMGIGATAGLTVTDKITEHSQLSAGLGYNFNYLDPDDDYPAYEDELETYHAFSLNGGWRVHFSTLNDWFLSDKTASINGTMTFSTTGKKTPSVTASASVQQPLPIARLRLLGNVSGYYSKNPAVVMCPSQNVVGTTIMPGNFHAEKMFGTTAGLEFGVAKLPIATLSVYGLYELFLSEDWNGSNLLNQGYSAGAKLYLKKIAFPAMALGFSHNLTKNKAKFSVALGVGF